MYTKANLVNDIKKLGIKPTDVISNHTSLKSVGQIETQDKTGAEVLIEALRECVPNGLLAVPSHTYKNVREEPVFDIRNTMPCIGAVPCAAVKMANEAYDRGDKTVIRSYHFTHSLVAFGKDAHDFTKDDRNATVTMPEEGCYGKLHRMGAKFLFIGVTLACFTFGHYIDARHPLSVQPTPFPVTGIDYDGTKQLRTVTRSVCVPPCSGHSGLYVQYEPFLKEAGALTYGKIGDADTIVCDAKIAYDVITQLQESGFCLEEE